MESLICEKRKRMLHKKEQEKKYEKEKLEFFSKVKE